MKEAIGKLTDIMVEEFDSIRSEIKNEIHQS